MKYESIESYSDIHEHQLENTDSPIHLENISNTQEAINVAELQGNILETFETSYHNIEKPEVLTDFETTKKIADYLESVEEIKFEKWNKLTLEQRKDVLNQIEQHVAAIEHRPALKVELELMKPRNLGYQSADEYKIALNTMYVGSNNPKTHREVIDTIIHEGRHAYQHYNVDVKLIHESGAEVATWRENFYDPKYKYYHATGNKIIIPYDDGSMHDVDFRLYYYQPVEIDARNFAGEVMSRLEVDKFVCKREVSQTDSKSAFVANANEISTKENSIENNSHKSQIMLTDEEIKTSQFMVKLGEIEKIDPLDKIQGHVKGYHIIDWHDTAFFKPKEVESDVTVVKDHLTNKLYISDSIGYKAELHKTTAEQEKATGFKYSYEDFGQNTIAIKDVRTFHLSDKEIDNVLKDLQTNGLSEKDAKELIANDPDKAKLLVNKFKDADTSLDDLKQLTLGNSLSFNECSAENSISFEGQAEDQRNSEASKFQDKLRNAHISPGTIYTDNLWGGFDSYTTRNIKEAIIRARNDHSISDSTYQNLMYELKKASHFA